MSEDQKSAQPTPSLSPGDEVIAHGRIERFARTDTNVTVAIVNWSNGRASPIPISDVEREPMGHGKCDCPERLEREAAYEEQNGTSKDFVAAIRHAATELRRLPRTEHVKAPACQRGVALPEEIAATSDVFPCDECGHRRSDHRNMGGFYICTDRQQCRANQRPPTANPTVIDGTGLGAVERISIGGRTFVPERMADASPMRSAARHLIHLLETSTRNIDPDVSEAINALAKLVWPGSTPEPPSPQGKDKP